MLPLFGVFPAFPCSALGAFPLNMALFRVLRAFLGRFMGFVWVCVVLALCVACVGFCARVDLGGLKACGVFAFLFILFAPVFISFSAFFACPLVLCLCSLFVAYFGLFCFFFPFGLCTKRKGTKVLLLASSLRVLWAIYKSLNITVISCGSSFQCRLPLQMIPATASG